MKTVGPEHPRKEKRVSFSASIFSSREPLPLSLFLSPCPSKETLPVELKGSAPHRRTQLIFISAASRSGSCSTLPRQETRILEGPEGPTRITIPLRVNEVYYCYHEEIIINLTARSFRVLGVLATIRRGLRN